MSSAHNNNVSEVPNIISRKEWGARDSVQPLVDINKVVNYAVVHHSATGRCYTPQTCASSVRSFQNYHIDGNKWDDIGYSFVVGEDGNIYEGRGWNKVGAHSPVFNRDSIGGPSFQRATFSQSTPTNFYIFLQVSASLATS